MGWLPEWLGGAPPPPKKKICCACPETKGPRDACVTEHGASGSRARRPPSAPPPTPRPPPPLGVTPPTPWPWRVLCSGGVAARSVPPGCARHWRGRGEVAPRGRGAHASGEARAMLTRSRAGGTLAGPEARECQALIEKHKECLRAEGFNV